jgi:hypothetical protein
MSPPEILLLLRLLSAALLLAFLGTIAWLIYHDMKITAAELSDRQRQYGYLRVIGNESDAPPVGTLFPLLPMTSIGRAPSNTIVLDHGYTSAEHALLTRRGRQWWLEDLGSRNGTLLNESPLEEAAVVSAGDTITIGDVKLKIELEPVT